jgi:hypothetical protein
MAKTPIENDDEGDSNFKVVRLLENGEFDETFGNAGLALLVRLLTDGSLDPTLGTAGICPAISDVWKRQSLADGATARRQERSVRRVAFMVIGRSA